MKMAETTRVSVGACRVGLAVSRGHDQRLKQDASAPIDADLV